MSEPTSTARNGLPALHARTHLTAVGRYATRYPDSAWLDLLALRATSGRQDAEELIAAAAARTVEAHAGYLSDFAFVLAACAEDAQTLRVAADLFTTARHDDPEGEVDERTAGVWLQTLHLSGMLDHATIRPRQGEVGAQAWWGVHTDRSNPFLPGAASPRTDDLEHWLGQFSMPFTTQGRPALSLRTGDESAFDRLTAPSAMEVDGPLVSVVVPVYNPPAGLLTSIRSLLEQTWANIEVLICDDGSVTGLEYLAACADLGDHRVRVLRSETNHGRYAALNRGLAVARGEYVAFQDADDYSHPERLEAHVRRHLAEDAPVATTSHAIRASAQLALTSIGMRLVTTNASSLMFEREPVLDRLGGYDSVRKAADTEFINRFAAVFGADRLHRMDDVLAVIQTTPNSLSRGELGFLRRHPARQAYRAAADAWHDQIRAGADPFVVGGERAPFPAPAHISGQPSEPRESHDLVLLTSVVNAAPTRSPAMVSALADRGVDVAVVEFVGRQDVLIPDAQAADHTLGELINDGRAHWALPGETCRSRLALVDDPTALLVMPAATLASVTADVLVVTFDEHHGDLLPSLEARLRALRNVRPVWLPANNAAATRLRGAGTSVHVLEPARWWVGTSPASAKPQRNFPVVGLISPRFTTLDVTDTRPRPCLPQDPATGLWIWGPGPPQVRGHRVRRVRPATCSWNEFISSLDYFVAPTTAYLSTWVMDAWSAGTTVLAANSMRALLQDRALYPGRAGVDAVIAEPGAAQQQATAAARAWVRRRTTPEALYATYQQVLAQVAR